MPNNTTGGIIIGRALEQAAIRQVTEKFFGPGEEGQDKARAAIATGLIQIVVPPQKMHNEDQGNGKYKVRLEQPDAQIWQRLV